MSTAPPPAIASRRLSQGITATWWYTASGVMFFQLTVAFVLMSVFIGMRVEPQVLIVAAVASLVWCASSVPLLVQYRHRDDTAGPVAGWRSIIIPIAIGLAFGAFCGVVSGLWLFGVMPIMQTVMLLNWPRGIRLRLLIASAAVLAALWFIDWRMSMGE